MPLGRKPLGEGDCSSISPSCASLGESRARGPWGSTELALGDAAAFLGRTDDAIRHLRVALAAGHPREIASLVAKGLTNMQIADTAHISNRTAENHVQHILTKLGFQNRSQIAVWVTQLGHPPEQKGISPEEQ
jgi:DNA-binding CsgD family transcriptional regulator